MAQATDDSSNSTLMPQISPEEMRGLAARLRARAQSVLLRHQPEQHRDLLTAANLIEQFANLSTEILATATAVDRLSTLLGIVGGA
jgi:hypothetical protein